MSNFQTGKTIRELGIDTKRTFVVTNKHTHYEDYKNGDLLELFRDDGSTQPRFRHKGSTRESCPYLDELSYAELQAGSVLTRNGTEMTILHVDGPICFIKPQGVNAAVSAYSIEKLKENGWVDKEAKPPVREMTVQEVSALVGSEVKIVESR